MSRRLGGLMAAVLAAAVLAGCGSTVSVATATRRWASAGSFRQSVWDLLHDAQRIHGAIVHRDPAGEVRSDCVILFNEANGSNTSLLPSTDPQLTTLLSSAYDTFIHAAAECDSGPVGAAAFAAVDHGLRVGVGDLYAAALREEAVARRSLHLRGLP